MTKERITIEALQGRLREYIRSKIAGGKLTGSSLAHEANILQAHLSNFLNGRRGLSTESTDRLLAALAIGVLDLVKPADIHYWYAVVPSRSPYDLVPRVAPDLLFAPRFPQEAVRGVHCVDRSLLRKLKSNDVAGRATWNRFVFIRMNYAEFRGIMPAGRSRCLLLVDRHYNALEPHHRGRENLYLVQLKGYAVVARVFVFSKHLLVHTCDDKRRLQTISLSDKSRYVDYIVGRICELRAQG